jgi:hypothetical protein
VARLISTGKDLFPELVKDVAVFGRGGRMTHKAVITAYCGPRQPLNTGKCPIYRILRHSDAGVGTVLAIV